MDNLKDYYLEHVNAPWGKIFYDLLFGQLIIPQSPKLNMNEIIETIQNNFFLICSEWKKYFNVETIRFYC